MQCMVPNTCFSTDATQGVTLGGVYLRRQQPFPAAFTSRTTHPVRDESSSSRDTKTVLSQRLREEAFALEKSLLIAVAVDLDLHAKSTTTTATSRDSISVAWGRRPTGGQDVSVVPEVPIERVGSTAVGSANVYTCNSFVQGRLWFH